jgi:hypothetical protein
MVNQAGARVFSGETVKLGERLRADNTGSYNTQISCDQRGLTASGDGRTGSYRVPNMPVAVMCSINNRRTSATLVLQKAWTDAIKGDTAHLSIDGATSGPGFAIATVPGSGTGLSADKATTVVFSGEIVHVAERPGAGNGESYVSRIRCGQPGLTVGSDGRSGNLHVPPVPVAVTCTVTNSGPGGTSASNPPSPPPPSTGSSGPPPPAVGNPGPPPAATGPLSATGVRIAVYLFAALALIAAGVTLLRISRRRRRA